MAMLFLIVIFAVQTVFAQVNTINLRSEGSGSTSELALHNALTRAVLNQIDALVVLKSESHHNLTKKMTRDIKPFIRGYHVVQADTEGDLHRTVLDVELDLLPLVKKLVQLNLAQDFRDKPRVIIDITEKTLGEVGENLPLTTAFENLLSRKGFEVISQTSMRSVPEELIAGVAPDRLSEIAEAQNADILINGYVDITEVKKSSLLKNADLQPYIMAGSVSAVDCGTGKTCFAKNFSQPVTSTSLEKARQMGLKKLLSVRSTRGIAKPLLTGILQPWPVQAVTEAHR